MKEGARFGHYTVGRRLAFGGMAEIFSALMEREQGFSKRVVLKLILPQYCADPDFVRMFIDEAVIAAQLTHQNIVQVYDFGAVDGRYFIAMEMVNGCDLRTLLRAVRTQEVMLRPAEVAALGEGLCRGLAYAHTATDDKGAALNVVHRDISPHNVMLSRSGEPKIMDFGIAKAAARRTSTGTGVLKGKVPYMSPEQASGSPLDARSDQFSLALVLWECLSGERLFQGDSDLEMLKKISRCELRPLQALRPDVPDALDAVIFRALRAEPQERFADLVEMGSALSAFRFSLGEKGNVDLGDLVRRLVAETAADSPEGTRLLTLPGGVPEHPKAEEVSAADLCSATESEQNAVGADWSSDPGPTTTETAMHVERTENKADRKANPGPSETDIQGHTLLESLAPHGRRFIGKRWLWLAMATGSMVFAVMLFAPMTSGVDLNTTDTVDLNTTDTGLGSSVSESISRRVELQENRRRVQLRVDSTPQNAEIAIDGTWTGLRTPAVLSNLEAQREIRIGLKARGYQFQERRVLLKDEDEHIEATLKAQLRIGIRRTRSAPSTPEVNSRREKLRLAQPQRTSSPEATGGLSTTGEGHLSVRSTGVWAEIYLGAQKIGTTPLNGHALPAGKHLIRLVNPEMGWEKELKVQIAPGKHAQHTITMKP